jgi:Zn-dependent peptidase ImmA (M78 family)
VVQVPTDFRRRLRVPETARAVMNETLAHELGHMRLHAQAMLELQTKQRDWEKQANRYARVFLVPLTSLLSRLPMQLLLEAEDEVQRWRLVLRLAEEFEVTGWFMGSALEMYGLAHISHRRRLVRVQPLAHELVRRFAFARTA